MDPPLDADGVDRDDVGVMQLRGGPRLGLEPLRVPGVERGGEGRIFRATRRPSETCSAS